MSAPQQAILGVIGADADADADADKPAPGDPNKLTIAAQPDHTFVTGPDGGHSHVDH
jgi:hypothetical protein